MKYPKNPSLLTAITASLLLCVSHVNAQVPTNQLHFTFSEAHGIGAKSTSDTTLNASAIVTSITNYNPAGVATDLHGNSGSGLTNGTGGLGFSSAMDFTTDFVASQTNQPANSPLVVNGNGNADYAFDGNDPNLANLGNGGTISSFVATMWFKQPATMLAGSTVGPRLWILNAGTAGVDSGANVNTMGLKFQLNNQLFFQFGTDTTTIGPALASPFPTNKWLFIAIVYDSTNFYEYYGTDTSAPQLLGTAASAGRTLTLGASACLAIGNRRTAATNARGLNGWINDFRFYNGWGDASFIQSVWGSAIGNPPLVNSTYPDGKLLMQGTNTFTFNAISQLGLNITNATLQLNALNASSQLIIVTNGTPGTSSNLTYSYTNLQPNQTYTATITLQGANGGFSGASVNFDTFYPTNFTVEAEEFDATTNGTTPQYFIDNPDYTATNGDLNSYYQLDSIEGIDTHKGSGNPATSVTDYRTAGDTVSIFKTQTPSSPDVNRQKFIDAATNDPGTVDHVVGNWASAEWQDYTKTFPAGKYNIYGRLSSSGAATINLAQVTNGAGTSVQSLSAVGSFNFNSGGINTYTYVPLKDPAGNLVVVSNLAGVSTLRLTSGGGANANFYMFVPANTNLPSITGVNPSGTVLFQPTNSLVFTASSAAGISTNSITMTVNGTNVSSQLVFAGSSTSWNVNYPHLQTNNSYAVVIHVTDANGNTATSTLNIDTYAPLFTWEAEDFDFGGGLFIDNPLPTTTPNTAPNSYCEKVSAPGVVGVPGIDAQSTPSPQVSPGDYRESDIISCPPVFDAARSLFLTNGNAQDYSLGFLHTGYWENYTKTFPAGTYNVYGRMANGQNPAAVVNLDLLTKGWGTTNQFTTSLGTFTVPNVGWSSYSHIPLRDKYGNFANVTLSGTNTLKATEQAAVNINFFMLTAARTDLPRIDNVSPNGSVLMQATNTFSFTASSPTAGVSTTNIHVTLNGTDISPSLQFSGSTASWNVTYPGLQPNTSYTATITMTDNVSQAHSPVTVSFDTFNPANFTWEAEDFDFDPANSPVPAGNGLRFIDNPILTDLSGIASNSYVGQVGAVGIDESPLFQGVASPNIYRGPADFVPNEITSDALRQKYLDAQFAQNDKAIVDYDISHLGATGWINYTRTFPTGNFNVYARLSAGNGAFSLQLAQVTNGAGTSVQSSNVLGNFIGTGASFTTWQYVPLVDINTNKVVVALTGVETLQIMGDTNENANFFVLVPAASSVNTNPATANFSYTVTPGGGGGGGSGPTVNFTWAGDHLGWQLYSNSVGLTSSSNWFPVPGSATVTNISVGSDRSKTNVFFQLRYP